MTVNATMRTSPDFAKVIVMRRESEMYPEDLERVRQVISSGVNSVERKPFQPLKLLAVVWIVVTLLGAVSYWLAQMDGFV